MAMQPVVYHCAEAWLQCFHFCLSLTLWLFMLWLLADSRRHNGRHRPLVMGVVARCLLPLMCCLDAVSHGLCVPCFKTRVSCERQCAMAHINFLNPNKDCKRMGLQLDSCMWQECGSVQVSPLLSSAGAVSSLMVVCGMDPQLLSSCSP
jgi:hypothetical protein